MKGIIRILALLVGLLGIFDGFAEAPAAAGEKQEIAEVREKVSSTPSGKKVLLVELVGSFLQLIPIPGGATNIFNQNIGISDMAFVPAPRGEEIATGIGFTGTLHVNEFTTKGTAYVFLDMKNQKKISIEVELPENYKLSQAFPQLSKLNELTLPRGKFVASMIDYEKDEWEYKYGLNFVADLELAGPLKALNTLKNKAKEMRSVVVSGGTAHLGGVIPPQLSNLVLKGDIPLRIGVDFTKIPQMPKSVTKVFKQLTTDKFYLEVTPPPKVAFKVGGSIRVVLGTQPAPLVFALEGSVAPELVSIGGKMQGQLELEWLSLGDFNFKVDVDEALVAAAAAFGIPFTGFGIGGTINLGRPGPAGECRAMLHAAGQASVKSTGMSDLVVDIDAECLKFGDFVYFLSSVATKVKAAQKPLPLNKIPVMNINQLKGHLALTDMEVDGKKYKAGIAADADVEFFGQTGKINMVLNPDPMAPAFHGSATMKPIDVKVLKISGVNGGDFNLNFMFDSINPLNDFFRLDGKISIPPLGIAQEAKADFSDNLFKWHTVSTNPFYSTGFDISIDPSHPTNFTAAFSLSADFGSYLNSTVLSQLRQLKGDAVQKAAQADADITKFSRQIDAAKRQGVGQVMDEINRVDGELARLTRERDAHKAKCKDIFTTFHECDAMNGLNVQIFGLQTYKETLLKPYKGTVEGFLNLMRDATKGLGDAQVLKKTTEGTIGALESVIDAISKTLSVIAVRDASGSVNGSELLSGKLPQLRALVVDINIPGFPKRTLNLTKSGPLQFDFTNPAKSSEAIVTAIVNAIQELIK